MPAPTRGSRSSAASPRCRRGTFCTPTAPACDWNATGTFRCRPRRSRATSFRRAQDPAPTLDGAIERVRDLTEESVALRMVAAVPVGCLLSGGLDSSAVLGVAASCTDEAVAAFTVGFERRNYDESTGAREAAAAARCEPHRRHRVGRRPGRSLRRRRVPRRNAPVQHARRRPVPAQPRRP